MVEFCEIDQKEEDNHQEEEDGVDSKSLSLEEGGAPDNHFSKGDNNEKRGDIVV